MPLAVPVSRFHRTGGLGIKRLFPKGSSTVKKLSALTAALLAAGAVAVAPVAEAVPSSSSTPSSADYASVDAPVDRELEGARFGDGAPAISTYASAVGDMFKCGGSFGKLWC